MGTGSISVVVPTYGVAAYLPAFLASIQTSMDAAVDANPAAGSRVEFVFVDDGSPDASAAIIAEWIDRRPDLAARLVRQDNGGLSSARNAGLDVATGDWVTFPDPDDFVDRSYLGVLSRFTASPDADTVHIVCGRTIFYDHDGGTYRNTHPLRHRFDGGTRIVDLGREPHQIHVAANTGLFRRDVIEAYGLRFDAAVRPVWEDGHFTARYLSKFERPRIAMMADAVYNYRQRADGSSLMDGQWVDPDKFRTVPRKGWLDALRIAAAEHDGHVPPWIQNMVLYDLRGYFKNERRSPSRTANTPAEVSRDFFELLHEIFEHIDLDVLDRFRGSYIPLEVRQVLRMTFKGAGPRPTEIALDTLDTDRGLVRLHYFYLGAAPVESFRARGLVVAPVHAKTRPCAFYGHVLGYERVVWLPAVTSLSATLDGVATPLRAGPADIPRLEISRTTIWQTLTGSPPAAAPGSGLRRRLGRAKRDLQRHARWFTDDTERQRTAAQATLRLSRTPFYRLRYRDAWLLIDRDSQAQDNAEHLYRWLRANRPKVNAFFVLARSSPDWARLSAEGFRLVDHRSREHDIALLNARHVLSSQIDNYITSPQSAELFGPENVGRWHYTFLQHGVTKDDLSIWINTKPIDLMITATPDEYRSIVDDTSPYIFSDREVKLTGFPRHDRLLELARGPEGKDPDLVLVMPTWRRSLVRETVAGGNDRELRDDFWQTDYATAWRSLLESEDLHRKADEHGYRIVFVPHPNMQGYLDTSPLPASVQVRRFSEADVQRLIAQGVVLVTDYSSMAFEMAYIERPVVYFQFDQHDFFSGEHAYRRGSWSYEQDGFGPVTVDAGAAVAAIGEILDRGGPEPVHAERMSATFPYRDGECCRRTHDAVVAMTVALTDGELYRTIEAPEVLAGRPVADELRG